MEIFFHKKLDSTQLETKRVLKEGRNPPFAVVADIQKSGVGSRNNCWDSLHGNLFLSFAVKKDDLPDDLELSSTSIYFGYILKLLLEQHASTAWLKWPNDIYLGEKKIGGIITHILGDNIICGIGLNLVNTKNYACLDIDIDKIILIKSYFNELKKIPSWKKIFSKFSVEFDKSKSLKTHVDGERVSLKNASLMNDGSLKIDGKRVYSLR